ncbi:CPBP family intramembrane metalloprotease [Parenemella sanctibonifatiensis]|uniref:CPBP family intramembrane metalloprotease n=2 Tax=Parenemella sanctibonifatiensis TaxID=2016505 RepID=A0A255E8L2_9ACTN|nr:CPBP family intramembrane metalloprotease [Parenemella sanctibonifatiensis]
MHGTDGATLAVPPVGRTRAEEGSASMRVGSGRCQHGPDGHLDIDHTQPWILPPLAILPGPDPSDSARPCQVGLTSECQGSFTSIMNAAQAADSTSQTPPSTPVLVGALVSRLLMILALGLLTPVLVRLAVPDTTALEGAFWTNATVIVVDLLTIALVGWLLAREGKRIGELLHFKLADLGWGLLLAVILYVVFLVATIIGNLVAYQGAPPVSQEQLRLPLAVGILAIVAAVTIAIAEELLYRGYLQPRFEAKLGRWPGMLLVALVFGLQHIGFALTSPQAMVSKVVSTLLVGIVFGLLYWWRKRLMPLIIAHALVDIVGLGLPTLLIALS